MPEAHHPWRWTPPAPLGDHLLAYPSLTHAQCDALAELAATLTPEQRVDLLQTHTETGGTHLYVRMQGFEFHIARSGNVTDLGAY